MNSSPDQTTSTYPASQPSTTQHAPSLPSSSTLPSPLSNPISTPLITSTTSFVRTYMSQPHFDASHDYAHIQRVLGLSHHLLHVEQATHPSITYNPTIITLAALLHDVGDRKYISPSHTSSEDLNTLVQRKLLSFGAETELAGAVQAVVSGVSYSTERKNPLLTQRTLLAHPELAIVQDADRLDAIGAVGIGRTFTYGGAKGSRGMEETIAHFTEKLEKLEGMMKTGEGKRMAKERTRRLREFRGWWEEESAIGLGEEVSKE